MARGKNSRISGITIEVNGDTTKLDKALRSANSTISQTEKDLKAVEKALKLDPGNVEMLEQKQRLLSKSTEDTKDRYDLLKNTLENVTASNPRWEKWEKEQAAFTGQITKTENELQKLEKAQKQISELGFAPDSEQMVELQGKIVATKGRLEELQTQMKETYEEMGRPVSIEAYDEMQRELVVVKDAADDAEKAFRNFNQTAEQVSAVAGKVSDGASKVANETKGISTMSAGGAAGLLGMAVNAGLAADDLNTLAKQTQFSTERLQELQYASDRIDVSMDTITQSAAKLKNNLTSTSSDVQAAFDELNLGTAFRDGSLAMRDMNTLFFDVIGNLSQIQNETERDTIAMTLFGRSADQLAGLVDDGGEAFRGFAQEAHDLGLILSQDALDGANQFNDALDTLKIRAKAAFFESGAALAENLAPALENIVEVITKVLQAIASIDGDKLTLLLEVLAALAVIAPIASGIAAIAGAIAQVSQVVGVLSGALTAFNITGGVTTLMIGKWAIIILAVVAAVWLLVQAFNALTGASSSASKKQMPSISDIMPSTTTLPALASGTVVEPNRPFAAILGDNTQEPEIVAPYSTIYKAAADAVADGRINGGTSARNINATMVLDGRAFARLIVPYMDGEQTRVGISLSK